MTAHRDPQQLFPLRRGDAGGDAYERTLASLGQNVVQGDSAPLPEALRPDATRDAPAPSLAEQESRRDQQAQHEPVDRAALNRLVSIADIVRAAGLLQRGTEATCPMCGRRKLNVRPSTNTARCFGSGCPGGGESWDPVRWYMNVEGYTLPEAAALIRGEPLPGGRKPKRAAPAPAPRPEAPVLQQRPFTPLQRAAQAALWAQETPAAVSALGYMLSRGFSGDELVTMGIGVADSTVPESLLPLNAEGKVSMAWRNRIIIPTLEAGEAVNLKARSQEPDPGQFKYLNPSGGRATIVGLEALGGQMPDDVLLVEGELDYWSARFLLPGRPVVAVRGLENLSAEQAALFTCCRVFVLLDADTLGRRMLLGDLKDATDAEAAEILKGEGSKFGAAVSGRRVVRRLHDAGADPWICEMPDCGGDLNDVLAAFFDDRTAGAGLLEHAIQGAEPLYRRRARF